MSMEIRTVTKDGMAVITFDALHGVDFDGNPVRRSMREYPYSYDEFVVWKSDDYKRSADNHTVCSDRMYQWDYKKYNKCCREVWGNEGQYFDNRSREDIERFLQLYFGHDLKLVAIAQACNASNGYPYWTFYLRED